MMCPICWATAIVAFGAPLIAGGVSMALGDKPAVAASLALVGLAAARWFVGWRGLWWLLPALAALVLVRLAFVAMRQATGPRLGALWRRACQVAANRCPRKSGKNQP